MSELPQLSPDDVVRRAEAQASCDLGDERVLLNVASGVYYGLDAIGSRIWELLEEPLSVGALAGRLREEYEVEHEDCLRDLRALLLRLDEAGLIEVASPGQRGDRAG